MRRMTLALFIGAWLAAPTMAPAARPPAPETTQDSVVATGAIEGITDISVVAHSDPNGENPTGRASFVTGGTQFIGDVTCVGVTGNTAVVKFIDPVLSPGGETLALTDGGPSGIDTMNRYFVPDPTDCSSFGHSGEAPVSGGGIVIHDASALPTSKDQCENGGWRDYGVFKNHGDCVSFVATSGKNPPGKTG